MGEVIKVNFGRSKEPVAKEDGPSLDETVPSSGQDISEAVEKSSEEEESFATDLADTLEGALGDMQENFYRHADYEFRLSIKQEGSGGGKSEVYSLVSTGHSWRKEGLERNSFYVGWLRYFPEKSMALRVLNTESSDGLCGKSFDGAMFYADKEEVRELFANLREFIRLVEEDTGSSVSISDFGALNSLVTVPDGDLQGGPLTDLRVYRTRSNIEVPVKDALERVADNHNPSVNYTIE